VNTPLNSTLPLGSCLIEATQAQFHKKVPSLLRAPLHGTHAWRVGMSGAGKEFMERRGWVQPFCLTVTTPEQIRTQSDSFDRLFIPGEFCRQGDVLTAAAESGKTIFLERGAFLAPSDIKRAVEKLDSARQRLVLVEGGSAFGYSDRVLDPRSMEVLLSLGCPIALNMNPLISSIGAPYEHRPQWLESDSFDLAFIRTALAFNVHYLILPSSRELATGALDMWLAAHTEGR